MYESPYHDYDPSWDYELDEQPLKEVRLAVEHFLRKHADVYSALNLQAPHIFYVTGLEAGEHLAKFVSGTSADPFIVLDARYLLDQADEYGVRLDDAVESTLLHEYAHAYMETTGQHEDLSPAKEERLAEKFAKTYWKTRDLKKAVKVLAP